MPDEEELNVEKAVPLFPSMNQMFGEDTEDEKEEDKQTEITDDDVGFLKQVTSNENRRADGTPRKLRRPYGPRNKRDETDISQRPLPTQKSAKQLEKELAERGAYILMGSTGILGNIRPAIAMRADEAEAIANPLASYLSRQAPASQAIQEFVERWDLIAVSLATMAYLVRVWRDDIDYRKQLAAENNLRGAEVSRRRRDESANGVPTGQVETEQRPEDQNVSPDQDASTGSGSFGPLRVPYVPGV